MGLFGKTCKRTESNLQEVRDAAHSRAQALAAKLREWGMPEDRVREAALNSLRTEVIEWAKAEGVSPGKVVNFLRKSDGILFWRRRPGISGYFPTFHDLEASCTANANGVSWEARMVDSLFEGRKWSLKDYIQFVSIATYYGRREFATHRDCPKLIGRIFELGSDKNEELSWAGLNIHKPYRYQYPLGIVIFKHSLSECEDAGGTNIFHTNTIGQTISHSCLSTYASLVKAVASFDKEAQSPIRAPVLKGAMGGAPFDVMFCICWELGWIGDLEVQLQAADRFEDALKLLVAQGKWEETAIWLRQHSKFSECVLALEKAARFAEAAAALEKLGPIAYQEFQPDATPVQWTTVQQKESYDRKLGQLRAFAAAAGQTDAKPAPNLAELEERYAYGEISKAEYEKLKAQAAGPPAKTCVSCGQPVEPVHKFCSHCGARI